jgi:succinate-acetate transporter protein
MVYLPGSGFLAAYTDSATGELNSQFANALRIWIWAWSILTTIFVIGSMRSSLVLFIDLFLLVIDLTLLACVYMLNIPSLLMAGNAIGFVIAFLSGEFFSSPSFQARSASTPY